MTYSVDLINREAAFSIIEDGSDHGTWALQQLIPLIAKGAAATHGRWRTQDIIDNWRKGDWEMWVATDEEKQEPVGVYFGRIHGYPTGLKIYEVVVMAGRHFKKWLPVAAPITVKHAKTAYQCDRITSLTHDFVANILTVSVQGTVSERDRVFEVSLLSLEI